MGVDGTTLRELAYVDHACHNLVMIRREKLLHQRRDPQSSRKIKQPMRNDSTPPLLTIPLHLHKN